VIKLEDSAAQSEIIEHGKKPDGSPYRVGYIKLPSFYLDMEGARSNKEDYRRTSKDLEVILKNFNESNVDVCVLDLSRNGGGSLPEAIAATGLFIDYGPVVQVKDPNGRVIPMLDENRSISWKGPLVVKNSQLSASASEIFAGAIQDYERGLIVGDPKSHGKGTVQNVIDLNQFVRGNTFGDLGALKTTTQKFYRINGGSTQLEGVKSDIAIPDRYSYLKMGERDIDNAMPWDKIDAADYKVWDKQNNFDLTISKSKERMSNNAQLNLIDDNAKWLDERNKENIYSLNIDKFKAEQKALDEKNKKYKPIIDYKNSFDFNSLPYEVDEMNKDSVLKEKRERWHESLSKDIYIEEAIHILNDLQLENNKGLTSKVKKEKLVKS
jgi:carboxyl-terminal processing protease